MTMVINMMSTSPSINFVIGSENPSGGETIKNNCATNGGVNSIWWNH
jgi:hypothetical protein